MTKEERVLRTIEGKDVDYLPSNIVFADRMRELELCKELGLSDVEELYEYMGNHLYLTLTLQDEPLFFRDDKEEMNRLEKMGFCKPDWKNSIVYDNWGMGIRCGVESLFIGFHPLDGNADKRIVQFMPPNVSPDVIFAKDLKTAVKNWSPPDINQENNTEKWEQDLREKSGEYLVWPSGYFGIFERTSNLMGWSEFMINLVSDEKTIEELLDKVTEYKIQHAKKMVELGFKVGHYGDDLGTQVATFVSKEMFQKIFKPRLKKIWDVFNDAGLPVWLHSCGKITDFLPDLIDIGLKVLEPVQPCLDLEYVKKEYGKDLVFFGGIDTQKLPFLSPEETAQLAKETIHILGKGGGCVVAPSQELMNDIPIENVKVLIETIKVERTRVLE